MKTTIAERLSALCEALEETPAHFATKRLGYDRPQKFYDCAGGKGESNQGGGN